MPAMKTSQIIKDRLYQYWLLMRFHKPIGIFLLLWPTLWALWIASAGKPDWHVMFVFVTGVVLMRAAGCVINDYADRNIDLHVARTNTRPLTAGQVSAKEALILFVVLCLTAFGLVLTLNTFTILLSFGGAALAIIYPFMKRYTHLPQVVLGMAFGWAVPMAFAAQTNEVPRVAWMLYVLAIIWPVIYDTMYAMVDREDDLKIGVKSTAILFGDADRIIIAGLQLILFAGFWLLGKQLELGFSYYFGLFLAAILAAYHQYLIRDRHPAACFKAFLHNNWLGAAIFLGLVFEYL